MKKVDVFIEIIKVSFKQMFRYKWTFAMTLISQPVLLILNYTIYTSIYSFNNTGNIKGYSLDQLVWYFTSFFVVQAFVYNGVTGRISSSILSGEFAMDLVKPMSVFNFYLANSIASRLIALIMDFLPGLVIYSIIIFPKFLTPFSFLRFIIIVLPAFMINYLISFMLGMSAMKIKSGTSINWISYLLYTMAGGALIPLEFYPAWLNVILDYLPFKYILYWPMRFFLNKDIPDAIDFSVKIFSLQILWIVVLYVLCRIAYKKLIKSFCAAGG